MRAGPLSDAKVINLLNSSFVPVHLLIKDYEEGGKASRKEKLEFARVCGDVSDAKKGVAFIVDPNGQVIETLISSPAITTDRVLSVLQNAAATIRTVPGKTLGEPVPQGAAAGRRRRWACTSSRRSVLTQDGKGLGPNARGRLDRTFSRRLSKNHGGRQRHSRRRMDD